MNLKLIVCVICCAAVLTTAPIALGASRENPTTLTCHDWHTAMDQIPWDQPAVKRDPAANGAPAGLATIRQLPAVPEAPTVEAFQTMMLTRGPQAAMALRDAQGRLEQAETRPEAILAVA